MQVEVPLVNGFVSNGQGGNPAGVVLNTAGLSDENMQYIANQVGASETAFVKKSDVNTHVRFFTPTVEVPLCGHATIAIWAYMFKTGLIAQGKHAQTTQAGLINLDIRESGLVFMEQPKQVFRELLDFRVISNELGIANDWIDRRYQPQIVQNALMVGVKSKQMLNSYILDKEKLLSINKKYGFEGLHLFVILDSSDNLAAVRDFDPIVGIDEDAATGTTNGSFLTYLKHYGLLPEVDIYKIEQGEAMGHFSMLYGKFINDRVWIGGRAAETGKLRIKLL